VAEDLLESYILDIELMNLNTYQNEDESNIQNFTKMRQKAIGIQKKKFSKNPILIYEIM